MEAKKAKKNKVRGIKNAFIVIIICFIVALVVFTQVLGAPENFEGGDPAGGHPLNLLGTIYKGGFIVPILQTLLLTVIVLSVERFIAMLSVKGKGNTNKFIAAVKAALEKGDVEAAKDIARNTRGPIASIYYQGLLRIDQGLDVVEKSVVSYGGVQAGYLEKGCSWITLFIAMAPSLGFLGTVIGMVQAFDKIQQVGDISPTVVAGGMKVALITTIFGLIVALILQVFYNYILSKIEALTSEMEDSSITLLDMVIKYNLKYKK